MPWLAASDRIELALSLTWNASRWFFALTIVGGIVVAWSLSASPLKLRFRSVILAAIGCLAFILASRLAGGLRLDNSLPTDFRLWELGPLLILLLGGFLWMPALLTERRHGLNEGLFFAFPPLILCQLEMLVGSMVIGHWQHLLAYSSILAGALVDYSRTQRAQDGARQERDDAAEELRSKTAELARLDLQRMVHAEKAP